MRRLLESFLKLTEGKHDNPPSDYLVHLTMGAVTLQRY